MSSQTQDYSDSESIQQDQHVSRQQKKLLELIKQQSTPRSVSVKDFAYDVNNPLHYGIMDQQYNDSANGLMDGYDCDEEEDDYDDEQGYMRVVGHINETEPTTVNNTNNIYNENDDSHDNDHDNTTPGLIQAIALYPFDPENENELQLVTNQLIIINYEYGEGWLVAQDPFNGKTGLVPSEYVQFLTKEDIEEMQYGANSDDDENDGEVYEELDVKVEIKEEEEEEDDEQDTDTAIVDDDDVLNAKPFLPELLQYQEPIVVGRETDETDEWEDVDDEDADESESRLVTEHLNKLTI